MPSYRIMSVDIPPTKQHRCIDSGCEHEKYTVDIFSYVQPNQEGRNWSRKQLLLYIARALESSRRSFLQVFVLKHCFVRHHISTITSTMHHSHSNIATTVTFITITPEQQTKKHIECMKLTQELLSFFTYFSFFIFYDINKQLNKLHVYEFMYASIYWLTYITIQHKPPCQSWLNSDVLPGFIALLILPAAEISM